MNKISWRIIYVCFLMCIAFSCVEDIQEEQNSDSWIIQANLGQPLYKVKFLKDDVGFVQGETSIFKTTNAGKKWNALPNLSVNRIIDMYVLSEDAISALVEVENQVKLAVTSNAGSTWALVATPSQTVTKIYFISSTIGFAWNFVPSFNIYDSEFESYRTADGGATWTKMKNTSDQVINPVNFLFTSTTNGYASFGDFNPYLYTTTDGGITWSQGSYLNGLITSIKGQENDLCLISYGSGGDLIYIPANESNWTYIGPNPYGIIGNGKIDRRNDLIFYVDAATRILHYTVNVSSYFELDELPEIRSGANTLYRINDIMVTNQYAFAVGNRPDAIAGEKAGFVLRYKQ